MTPSPRWRKILRDLLQNKGRSILTIVSISVGVLAVGFTDMAKNVLDKGMEATYQSSAPSQVVFQTTPFRTDVTNAVRLLPGVADAQSRTIVNTLIDTVTVHGHPDPDKWQSLLVTAMPSFAHQSMDKISSEQGHMPTLPHEMALDGTSLQYLNLAIGQQVWVQTPAGLSHLVKIVGTVHDAEQVSSLFSGTSYGYIRTDELPQFGMSQRFNTLSVQVQGNRLSQSHIETVSKTVRDALRSHGVEVSSTMIPQPGKHWAYDIVHSITSVLRMIGFLDAILSACLVFNTVLAALTGQTRQIGVMKTFGASVGQLTRLYLGYVCGLSLIAFIIGLPFAILATKVITANSVSLLGMQTHGLGFSLRVIAEMLAVGVVLPMATVLYPIVSGARISVREAITGQAELHRQGHSVIDWVLGRIQGLPRGLTLALRNTFRRKGRLALTVFTLGLGGAVVIGTVTVQTSLNLTVNQSMKYTSYDLRVTLAQPQRTTAITHLAKTVKGVSDVQCWGQAVAYIVRSNGTESSDQNVLGVPLHSNYIHPQIVQGRWLQQGDTNAVVLDTYLLHTEPNIHLGQTLNLDVYGQEARVHVVGFLKKVSGEVDMYLTPSTLSHITKQTGVASVINVRTMSSRADEIDHIAGQLRSLFSSHGYQVASVQTTNGLRSTDESKFSVVMTFMKVMSVLITIVSGLGLMGTQSLNVLERTREIGIFRSIGASTLAIWSIVVEEGFFIAGLGFGLAALLSIPVSHLLSNAIGQSLFMADLNYNYAIWAVPAWFGIALVISGLSSLLPARNATRLTIRDVLAHDG